MDTLTMTTDQLHHLIDVLDEVLRQEEPNYTEWCSWSVVIVNVSMVFP